MAALVKAWLCLSIVLGQQLLTASSTQVLRSPLRPLRASVVTSSEEVPALLEEAASLRSVLRGHPASQPPLQLATVAAAAEPTAESAPAPATRQQEQAEGQAWHFWAFSCVVILLAVLLVGGYCVYQKLKVADGKEQESPRTVAFGSQSRQAVGPDEKTTFGDNAVITAKYSAFGVPLLAIVPRNLKEQFGRVANAYFLIIATVVLIGEQTGIFDVSIRSWSMFMTLGIMMGSSGVFAAFDDYWRSREDEVTNHRKVLVISAEQTVERQEVDCQDLRVGSVVYVGEGEAFPADLIILASAHEDGTCYVDTANLDGETNLKCKSALIESQVAAVQSGLLSALFTRSAPQALSAPILGEVEAEPPSKELYTFEGSLRLGGQDAATLALGPRQLLLRGTTLRNTAWCVGVVVYTGRQTRMSMNAHGTPSKLSNIDRVLNRAMCVIVCVQFIMAVVNACLASYRSDLMSHHWYLPERDSPPVLPAIVRRTLTFFLLYSNLVPISLYVSLESVNLLQAVFINADLEMYDEEADVPSQVRAMNLCQELGQVEYVFSDKTGTLTQNVMELKRISVGGQIYGQMDANGKPGFQGVGEVDAARADDPEKAAAIDNFVEVLAVSHTVVIEGTGDSMKYQAESPDEGALVKSAALLGWTFQARHGGSQKHSIRGAEGKYYQELALNAFTSQRKRMSLIVRNPNGEVWLLAKGADNVMIERAKDVPQSLTRDIEEFALQGLRTLVIGRRKLSDWQLENWMKEYQAAGAKMEGREEALEKVAEKIEVDMELLGATAIEDKLQKDVGDTIKCLKEAGMKVWVLTGDKLETARIIGFACEVLSYDMDILVLDATDNEVDSMHHILTEMAHRTAANKKASTTSALMVTGNTLRVCFTNLELKMLLLEVAQACSVVIACRVSPSQKAGIVQLVRDHTFPTPVTLAIGDGANDVPMIQAAQVGVGIAGKEGKQAVNSADFAIGQFRFLKRLLLLHGRWNYRRTCKFILYSFYKNIVLVLTLFYFSFVSAQSGTSFYEDLVRQLYNLVLAFPVICVGIFDRDVQEETSLTHPALYKSGRLGLDLNMRKMLEMAVSALIHSIILVKVLAAAVPGMNVGGVGDYYCFGTAAFACLIMAMNYRLIAMTNTWNVYSVLAMVVGSFGFFVTALCLRSLLLDSMYMVPFELAQSPLFWVVLFVVPAQAMVVDSIVDYVLLEFFPSDVDLLAEADTRKGSEKLQDAVALINERLEIQEQKREAFRKLNRRSKTSSLARPPRTMSRASSLPVSSTMQREASDEVVEQPGELPQISRQASEPKGGDPWDVTVSMSFAFDYPEGKMELPAGSSAYRAGSDERSASPGGMSALSNSMRGMIGNRRTATGNGSKRPKESLLWQQKLPSVQTVHRGRYVFLRLMAVGLISVFVGLWATSLSESTAQVRVQYDGPSHLMPTTIGIMPFLRLLWHQMASADLPFGTHKDEVHYVDCSLRDEGDGGSRTCTTKVKLLKDMEPPVHVQYLVNPFFQNHNRYLNSVDEAELRGVPSSRRCDELFNGKPVAPCGPQPGSMFNDTFKVSVGGREIRIEDAEMPADTFVDLFANPPDYRAPDRAWLYERYPGVVREDKGVRDPRFMSHMRMAALGYAQKVYGVINEKLTKDQEITISIDARFPVSGFDGRKFVILTTTTFLGGRNNFLGEELQVFGWASLVIAALIGLQRWQAPRPLGERRSGLPISAQSESERHF